jgi:hypothetical protein
LVLGGGNFLMDNGPHNGRYYRTNIWIGTLTGLRTKWVGQGGQQSSPTPHGNIFDNFGINATAGSTERILPHELRFRKKRPNGRTSCIVCQGPDSALWPQHFLWHGSRTSQCPTCGWALKNWLQVYQPLIKHSIKEAARLAIHNMCTLHSNFRPAEVQD